MDIVNLANCVLAESCGGTYNGRPEEDTPDRYLPPEGMTRSEQDRILKDIINGPQDIQSINDMLNKKVPF